MPVQTRAKQIILSEACRKLTFYWWYRGLCLINHENYYATIKYYTVWSVIPIYVVGTVKT